MNKERVDYLHEQYILNRMSLSEFEEWETLVGDPSSDVVIKRVMDDYWESLSDDQLLRFPKKKSEEMLGRTLKAGKRKSGYWQWIASAAAIVIVAGSIALLNVNDDRKSVLAGKYMATLTLKNGKTILLDSAKSGLLIDASKLSYDDGTIINADLGAVYRDNKQALLKVQTPRGGTYEVILKDGTHVWLNADSKLEFPDNFTSNERLVKLSGEAYFEVSHNKSVPFKVASRGQVIEVLGTHFNVYAYDNEKIMKTTLLQGSVRVSDHGMEKLLSPGYQLSNLGNDFSVAETEVNNTVAWKNKQFLFESENIESIMKKVERWYDVKVVFTGKPSNETFSGSVSRFDNLSEVLLSLESTGNVSFKVKNRTVYVSM